MTMCNANSTLDWARYKNASDLLEAGDTKRALDIFHSLIGTSEEATDIDLVYCGIANCLRQAGRPSDAREYVEKALQALGSTHYYYPRTLFLDASIYDDLGERAKVVSILDLITSRYPYVLTDPNFADLRTAIYGLKGINLAELQRFSDACPLLVKAVKEGYWKERTLYYLGYCCYNLEDWSCATQSFTRALSLKLSHSYETFAHYFLGGVYLKTGRAEEAKHEYEWCFLHDEEGRLKREHVLQGLINASKGLGRMEDVKKYSAMLRPN